MGIAGGLFVFTLIAYLFMRKMLSKSDIKHIKQLKEGTKEKKYTSDVLYQKLYIYFIRIPFLKRYVTKLRRKLEIINLDDEYLTRKQTARILSNAMLIILPLTILIVVLTYQNALLLSILLLFEVFLIETIMSGMVDKLDTKLLKQQIEFFAEIRHAYHEYNMVEEAIYEVSQKDQLEVSRQGEKIYEILISDDPETELEKYYDVAPKICLAINEKATSDEIYSEILKESLIPAIMEIENGNTEKAHEIYKNMVLKLKEKYLGE